MAFQRSGLLHWINRNMNAAIFHVAINKMTWLRLKLIFKIMFDKAKLLNNLPLYG